MKIRTKHSPLILLLLPAVANALSSHDVTDIPGPATIPEQTDVLPQAGVKRHDVPTKDAPVDGRDGKPHHGPFIETEDHRKSAEAIPDAGSGAAVGSGSAPGTGTGANIESEAGINAATKADASPDSLPELKGRPNDPTVVDGEKIPESNDGVMFDKARVHAQEGTTGTEGGVTERYKARKLEEDLAGEETFRKPSSPKEAPPLPHSEEEKIRASEGEKTEDDTTGGKADDVIPKPAKPVISKDEDRDYTAGLEKPADLPDRPLGQNKPVQDPAKAPPVDLSRGTTHDGHHDEESIIQPFHSFVLSFTMILVSEIGDKTFLVAALMAMKHDRMVVFTAAFGALLVMTVLSAVLGHAVPTLIPKRVTSFLAAGLFFVFGAKLMREGMQMDPNEGVSAEMHEVEQELAEKEKEMGRKRGDSVSAYTLEMGMNGNGRRSRPSNRLMSPPRSPSQSPVRDSRSGSGAVSSVVQGATNLCSLLLSPAWVQTFIMTFLGEWGDRSQIATIAMAAGQDYWWVTLGATCGHAICTGVAVIGGRAIAGRVSLKVVTVGGATAFLVFGVIYLLESLYS
ncbi:GCR1-dependent translation factor 1 [Fusarium irregulare]|uniref:GCR1-dependent translation factor 1 n=1 Tax=Fusarium irregulare TaxID=2494466 RepID=A0A9W8PVU4_9HYPO|nr:GCR1-dependent translation factor 1 [Fusarium irregulare]KAJ4027006.1 GCR1-dependent translation factor 1 [Fusarium irregulare]